jgi:ABC-2 type transport system permease protein
MKSAVGRFGLALAALALALALAALYILAAGALFAYIHRLCVRTGLIARYSAESVT